MLLLDSEFQFMGRADTGRGVHIKTLELSDSAGYPASFLRFGRGQFLDAGYVQYGQLFHAIIRFGRSFIWNTDKHTSSEDPGELWMRHIVMAAIREINPDGPEGFPPKQLPYSCR